MGAVAVRCIDELSGRLPCATPKDVPVQAYIFWFFSAAGAGS